MESSPMAWLKASKKARSQVSSTATTRERVARARSADQAAALKICSSMTQGVSAPRRSRKVLA